MKRSRFFTLLLALCLCLAACSAKDVRSEATFYYGAEPEFTAQESSIGSEVRKAVVESSVYPELISLYLEGPKSSDLQNPFPDGTTLVYFSLSEDVAQIVLSEDFSQLSGIDLTIACACLSLTVRDLAGCNRVEITAQDSLLDNQESIVMDAAALSLYDSISE